MNPIPRDEPVDSSLAFKAEGYEYIGNRCRRFGSDIFEARLLGKRYYCVHGTILPVVAGVVLEPFDWNGHRFEQGDRFILDLYGTNRDADDWDEPGAFRPERFVGWSGNAFSMIPQGGGDHFENHRCAGEWLTIAVMTAMLRVLVREIDYDVPPQDLSVDLSEIPALPKSGFVIRPRSAVLRRPT